MTRDEVLREIQRRIAEAKGYTDVRGGWNGTDLIGVLSIDAGHVLVPRWPWEWSDAGALLEEMGVSATAGRYGYVLDGTYPVRRDPAYECTSYGGTVLGDYRGRGATATEAIARCWCAWKGIDLSDLP